MISAGECPCQRIPGRHWKSFFRRSGVVPMDVPYVQEGNRCSCFGVSAGIGFDAAVCQEASVTPMKKVLNRLKLGKLIYLFSAVKQLLLLTPGPMSITMDGRKKTAV